MEEKHGTVEEFLNDAKNCGFRPDPSVAIEAGIDPNANEVELNAEISLEVLMAKVRADVDGCLEKILSESNLPLFLFDYVVTSVLADIRKADVDMLRMQSKG